MSIITAFILAGLAPIAGWLGNYAIQDAAARNRKRKAYQRVSGEPTWFKGAQLVGVWREGVAEPFLCESTITDLQVGRMEITENDSGYVAVFTNEEIESMYLITKGAQA